MTAKSTINRNNAKQWVGKPVFIELKDGRTYIGWVTGAERGQLSISGRRSPKKVRGAAPKHRSGKAQVSSFLPGMLGNMMGGGSLFGGGGGGAGLAGAAAGAGVPGVPGAEAGGGFGLGGLGGFMGFLGKAMPMMKMGFGMIKTIMPLLKVFKA
jgi:hypothetical protein